MLCEGGGRLAATLLGAGLVDELVTFHAGLALGAEGRPAIGPLALAHLADARRFHLVETLTLGADIMTRWLAPD